MKRPRVKDVLIEYQKGGIGFVEVYFKRDDISIDPSTWVGTINNLIERDLKVSASLEIEMITNKFNL